MNLSDKNKEQLISIAKTFIASFIIAGAGVISSDGITWTYAFWSSALLAGLRAGITAVIAPYLPIKLGGRK